jgi:hypothetical protein
MGTCIAWPKNSGLAANDLIQKLTVSKDARTQSELLTMFIVPQMDKILELLHKLLQCKQM